MPYRLYSGGKDLNTGVNLYNYVLPLDQTRTVKSIQLPNDGNVVLLAMTLANEPVPVPLAGFYNIAGIYSDNVTYSNPPLGGADGGGYTYSGSIIPTSLVWTNILFNFGPANSANVTSNGYVLSATNLNLICASNQTLPLPAGRYTLLRLLGAGVQGSQSGSFTVKFADGTTSNYSQSMSDWYSPSSFAGEVKATSTYRNYRDGTADHRPFYFYGYAFKLGGSKVTQSITLANNNRNLLVAAMSLVPLWAPTFTLSPFTQPTITAGQNYYGYIYTNASDMNGYAMTYGLVSGPSWLSVSSSGVLSGEPLSTNVGLNTFVVSVTDSGGLTNTATMNVTVLPAPAILPSASLDPVNGFVLSWSGGISPYQLQMSTNLVGSNWIDAGDGITSNSISILPTNAAAFYRIVGQ
jgi:hypothetical protein